MNNFPLFWSVLLLTVCSFTSSIIYERSRRRVYHVVQIVCLFVSVCVACFIVVVETLKFLK